MGTLNDLLQPTNSPIAQQQGAVSSYEFSQQNERNTVDLVHIRNFSFSAGTGGTLTLGGASNGNGVLLVKDSGGTTKVTADNAGITITDGKLTFLNTAGGTVLDGSGIVSSVNFANDQVSDNTTRTTTSTSYVDVPGSSLDPFVVTRTTRAFVLVSAQGQNIQYVIDQSSSMKVACVDSVNGDLLDFPLFTEWVLTSIDGATDSWGMNVDYQFNSLGALIDFTAGTHTLKLQYKVNGAGTAELGFYALSYILLGS